MLNPVPLFGLGNQARSVKASAQDRLNLYVEVNSDAEKHVLTYYPCPGLVSVLNLGSFPARGAYQLGGYMYVVIRNKLVRIANDFTTSEMGTLDTTDGRVDMADNGTQIILVDGPNGYILTIATSVFAKITDVDFPGGSTVTFLNQRFVVSQPDTGKFFCSALLDGSSWDALDFATAESDPDNLVRVMADGGQLYTFGEKSTEIWGDSGAADFPYAKVGGGAVEWGLAARWSLVKYADSMAFLRKNRLGQVQACLMAGGQAVPISTPQVEAEFTRYGDVSNATGLAYMLNGHAFYQVNFPSEGVTWEYDSQSKEWHRRKSGSGRHRAEIGLQLLGNFYATDYENGKVYRIDQDTYTDDGQAIAREFTSRHQSAGDYLHLPELWIEMETGVGTQQGQGQNPQVMLQVSRDGGKTYGNEMARPIGKVGQYLSRAKWNRLGRARDWVFKVRVTDPVKVVFTHAWGRFTR
ncbi:packaged DNA stabilization protein [Hydrogenophaga sp.]|uniref:packaged DNA stabilization protein n=1 Tax=Hydrogenophaga sp. TaxID=1904254 RepID=UPI0035B1E553